MPSAAAGLRAADARLRLESDGPNELSAARRHSVVREAARGLASPLVLVLLAAAGAAFALGQHVDAAIIGLMVALSAALDAVQTTRSHRAAERLRQSVAPTAT